jgi:pimeloyl-ACP methyl ester carboxylesterase
MDDFPDVLYARSGDVEIAYQVVGSGSIDLVYVMGWLTNLEVYWEEPSYRRFMQRLAGFTRLILFDKRGMGLSDRGLLAPWRSGWTTFAPSWTPSGPNGPC